MASPSFTNLHIRLACVSDAPSILAVYSPYIDTPITFEEEVPSLEDFQHRIQSISATYPYLVAEATSLSGEQTIIGYAYAHEQAERAAYAWNAELSVYLAAEAQKQGLGTLLYKTLIALLEKQGVKSAHGLVTVPNAASEKLHEDFGFERIATQYHAGYTCKAWRDVAWLVKHLSDYPDDPQPITPFPALLERHGEEILSVFAQANCILENHRGVQG